MMMMMMYLIVSLEGFEQSAHHQQQEEKGGVGFVTRFWPLDGGAGGLTTDPPTHSSPSLSVRGFGERGGKMGEATFTLN